MTNGLFITGTDTGVGKTVVTGLLAGFLAARGTRVVTQKWVQTGCNLDATDISVHDAFLGETYAPGREYDVDRMTYSLGFPASPHLAASMEEEHIEPRVIKAAFRRLSEEFDAVLAEGAGGVLVPLNAETMIADIAAELELKALVVVGNRLGAINHALMTTEVLRGRGVDVLGIVFNRVSGEGDERILSDNLKAVERFSGVKVLGELRHSKDKSALMKNFEPIGAAIAELMGAGSA